MKKVRLQALIPKDLFERLEKDALDNYMKKSSLVEKIINFYYENQGKVKNTANVRKIELDI